MEQIETAGEELLLAESPTTDDSVIVGLQHRQSLLVDALRRGETRVFEELYRLFWPMVHGMLLARVPRSEVDDVGQEVFLQVLQKIHLLRDSAAFGGWLATMTRNAAHDFHRSKFRQETPASAVPEAVQKADMDGEFVLEVMCSLPEAYRETLILRLVEGMTGPEIAVRTGLTPASVRVNLHRGMKLLREKLQGKEGP
ncbi:MAG: sigma-70 family RNA polymerase sigma factor [Blastocatellia bacterium]|nr:sigma-70 family RNA polymerase sigma factor [Blastocatellia bacterium]